MIDNYSKKFSSPSSQEATIAFCIWNCKPPKEDLPLISFQQVTSEKVTKFVMNASSLLNEKLFNEKIRATSPLNGPRVVFFKAYNFLLNNSQFDTEAQKKEAATNINSLRDVVYKEMNRIIRF